MKNNKLTLKSLQKDLEIMKATKAKEDAIKREEILKKEQESKTSNAAGHDIKNSYINNLHMKSSMFYLYLISSIIPFLSKIPYINKIIGLIAAYYGRTTIWKILVKVRKFFIVINSIIGVYIVFKTVGFSYDTFLANFVAIGNTYLEIISNLTSKLFNWFLELFDYKVVPTEKPTNKPVNSLIKFNNPLDFYNPSNFNNPTNPSSKKWIDELYRPHNITINTNPWYKDLTTWLWIGGIFGTASLLYLGIKFVTDPTFIEGLFGKPSITDTNNLPRVNSTNIPLTRIDPPSDPETPLTESFGAFISASFRKLNPVNWFKTPDNSETILNSFIIQQNSVDYDNRFYPFTEIHPFKPLYQRIKMLLLGESDIFKTSPSRFELGHP